MDFGEHTKCWEIGQTFPSTNVHIAQESAAIVTSGSGCREIRYDNDGINLE